MPEPLALSLFPGIGLLDSAFEAEGFCVVRGPDCLWGGDVRRFHPPAGRFDGIIGGPPCQSFSSLAHLVRANGHEPKFGNLIPEFERCVAEAAPAWFLMENVPQAPEPVVPGYGVRSFLLDNSALDAGDGWGQEQMRLRRFSYGRRGVEPPCLLRWIDLAVFALPRTERPVTAGTGFPHDEAFKGRVPAGVDGHDDPNISLTLARRERKRRQRTVTGNVGGIRRRDTAVTGSDGGGGVKMRRYRLADALRLQGLPEDFLRDAPFTAEGRLKAVANGVPLPMGRAIARAIKEALQA